MNLLVVEDDPDFRETCARWMTRKGHRVETAANGHEALEVCDRKVFDVAIVDMNMPGLSGLELLERMKSTQLETEVIILTGHHRKCRQRDEAGCVRLSNKALSTR